ncbi:MAG: TolC family protein, partial [Sphingobacteriales bacterium]
INVAQSIVDRRDWTVRKQILIDTEIAKKAREIVRENVRREILLRYWEILRYEESIALLAKEMNGPLQQLEIQARQAIAAGIRTSADLSANLLQIANLKLTILRYQAELDESLEQLGLLVGSRIESIRPRDQNMQDPGLKVILKGKQRTLEVENLRLEAETVGVDIAASGFWPSLSLSANFQSSIDSFQGQLSNLQSRRRGISYGLNLNVPLFSGLSDFHARQAAQSRRLAAEVRRDAHSAELDIRRSSAARRVELAYMRHLEALSLTKQSLDLQATVLRRQEAGLGSFDYVIGPRVQALELSLSSIGTFYDYLSIVTAEYSDSGSLDETVIDGIEKAVLSSSES